MIDCKDCVYFWDTTGTGKPILDECVCCFPGGGKNYFVDLEPCEHYDRQTTNPSRDKETAELEGENTNLILHGL